MLFLETAAVPTFYLIGMNTEASPVMRLFPQWAKILGLNAFIKGLTIPPHIPVEEYRRVMDFFQGDPFSLGAFISDHREEFFSACRDCFDSLDPLAERLGEIAAFSSYKGQCKAYAQSPSTGGQALKWVVPPDFWKAGGETVIFGAGSRSRGLSLSFAQGEAGEPRRIIVVNGNPARLRVLEEAITGLPLKSRFRFVPSAGPVENDRLVEALPAASLIINAVSLEEEAPGSPLTDQASYPLHARIWDLNYPGERSITPQAQAQQQTRGLYIEDGRRYFTYEWTQIIAAVFHVAISEGAAAELDALVEKESASRTPEHRGGLL